MHDVHILRVMDANELRRTRERIVWRCDNEDSFPGSKKWLAAAKAEKELAAFDAEHPEVVAGIRAEHAARVAS